MDPSLRDRDWDLVHGVSIGLRTFGTAEPVGNPALAAVRQIGHEVLETVRVNYPKALKKAQEPLTQ